MTLTPFLPIILPLLAACCFMAALWIGMTPPRRLSFTPQQTFWERVASEGDTWIRSQWAAQTREEAQILRISTPLLVQYMAISGLLTGAVAELFFHHLLVTGLAALIAGWRGPIWIIHRRFKQWQSFRRRDFAPLVLLLRIYFDLGRPVVQAFQSAVPALGYSSRKEIHRLLTLINTTTLNAPQVLMEWGHRTHLLEYRLLADTIAQNWNQKLTGEALSPLDTLIDASREQGTRSLADRLDAVSTFVPILAAFGQLVLIMYVLLAKSLSGAAGITL